MTETVTTRAGMHLLRGIEVPHGGVVRIAPSAAEIIAIEAEARQQERAAIRAKCSQYNPDHDPRWCRICSDIVDPSDD